MKTRKALLIPMFALMAIIGGSGTAFASHQFNDVPNGSTWHSAVDYIKERNITSGCIANVSYCPNDNVTRGQMAAFMQRLSSTLTPRLYSSSEGSGGHLLTNSEICLMGTISPAWEQQVVARFDMSSDSADATSWTGARVVYTIDGGTTWTTMPGQSNFTIGSIDGAWDNVAGAAILDLSPENTYSFALQTQSGGDVADSVDFRYCSLDVSVYNRMPGQTVTTSTAGAETTEP